MKYLLFTPMRIKYTIDETIYSRHINKKKHVIDIHRPSSELEITALRIFAGKLHCVRLKSNPLEPCVMEMPSLNVS